MRAPIWLQLSNVFRVDFVTDRVVSTVKDTVISSFNVIATSRVESIVKFIMRKV